MYLKTAPAIIKICSNNKIEDTLEGPYYALANGHTQLRPASSSLSMFVQLYQENDLRPVSFGEAETLLHSYAIAHFQSGQILHIVFVKKHLGLDTLSV